jgi:hypothetical protein
MLIVGIVGAVGFCAVALSAAAQDDPCDACMAQHGAAACPCLPVAVEPTPLPVPPPPPGGTIPPVTGIACLPETHAIAGCDDKAFFVFISGGAE